MFNKTETHKRYYLFFIENNQKGLEFIHKYIENNKYIKQLYQKIEPDFIIFLVSSYSPIFLRNIPEKYFDMKVHLISIEGFFIKNVEDIFYTKYTFNIADIFSKKRRFKKSLFSMIQYYLEAIRNLE